tara:strand:+ start:38 stop:502 length:465 start_codon:yes stop_codon:yes gene_type:complete
MTFFKETKTEFEHLSRKALDKLYENIVNNSKGTKSGVTRTALKKVGYSKDEIDKKMNTKKRDPKSILIQHLQEVWVFQRGRCAYSQLPMDEKFLFTGDQNIEAISVERINNNKGYVVGNIRLVIRALNKFRSVSEEIQFIDLLKRVSQSVVENV